MKEEVNNIKPPAGSTYFEDTSADGFAYLGYARASLGLDCSEFRTAITERNYTLGASRRINATGREVNKNTKYVYTMWACIEFLRQIGDEETVNSLVREVEEIGKYGCGMQRYCDTEINYVVPNVTSAAALISAYAGQTEEADKTLNLLRSCQRDGNWDYYIYEKDGSRRASGPEDSLHLGMMIYQIREAGKILSQDVSDMLDPAVERLVALNKGKIADSSIGNASAAYLATYGTGLPLEESSRAGACKLLTHNNFRKRAFAAFSLTKGKQ